MYKYGLIEAFDMPNERTPLIQTIVVAPPPPRYSHNYVRRFCTAALSLTLVVIIILFLVPARWLPGNHSESEWLPAWTHWGRVRSGHRFEYEELQSILLNTPKEENAKEWSKYYTSGPHLAGQNHSQAQWTMEKWQSWGIESSIVDYDVYLNYPLKHRLALLESGVSERQDREPGEVLGEHKVKYEAKLEEDVLENDPTSGLKDRIPTFHGYGANGNVTARYVYANRGTYWDFEDLVKANVSLKGNIAIVRYGQVFRGLKVKRAQELGMVGVVVYSDPDEDGEIIERNGYKSYPDGPARQPSSVQRGSVQFINILSGDPTTPGYASKRGVHRDDPSGAIPHIPSQPISYQDAIPILRSLNGHGPKVSDFNEHWQGGKLDIHGVDYNIGPSPPSLQLNLAVEHEYTTTPLWDVIGIINGTIADEVVILGNHRDAWIAGGAGDPNSGSAALNEIVRSFGTALQMGWKPLRTIIFASWDGEEYALIGSTEWVEEYMPWLNGSAVAYLNVDVGTMGQHFGCSASPLLNRAIYYAAETVLSPNQTVANQSIRNTWDGKIRTIGSGSDFTAFQDFAGIPSVDMGFRRGNRDPVYHYHSNYDSFAWMEKYGDSGWHYHIAAAKLWAVLAAELIESPVIGFNVTDYALGLQKYLDRVKINATVSSDPGIRNMEFPTLEKAIAALHEAATTFDAAAAALSRKLDTSLPWWRLWEKASLHRKVRAVNRRYKFFEHKFLYDKGLDGRPLFKHVVFAPGYWTGYSGVSFPGLTDAMDTGDMDGMKVSLNMLLLLMMMLMANLCLSEMDGYY